MVRLTRQFIPLTFSWLFLILTFSCKQEESSVVGFKIVAHRGCWQVANDADNSIQGLRAAAELGVDGVELDVISSKDDSLLVVHGPKHGCYEIANSSFEEVRSVRLPNGECVPTLREYLLAARSYSKLILCLDLKSSDRYEAIIETVHRMNCPNLVIYLTSLRTCMNIKKEYPTEICFCSSSGGNNSAIYSNVDGLSGFIEDLKQNPSIIKDARNSGLFTMAWTVNIESELVWCATNNLDYIITNDPLTALTFRSEYCK